MTDPAPAHGCMIDGQPAMPILISEYNALVARAAEAEASARRAEQAEAEVKRLGLMVDEYGAGAGALTDKLKRVRDLRDRWVKAGPPPLGTPIARWVDRRLVELNTILDEPARPDVRSTS